MTKGADHAQSHIAEITTQWQRERPDIDQGRFLLPIYLQRLGRLIEQDFERICAARFAMRASDMRVLLALRRCGVPYAKRPTDLFRALLVTSGAMTKQVDRLEERKLVRRLSDPDYAGGFLVQLTDRGRKMVDAVVDLIASGGVIAPAMAALSEDERADAVQMCFRVITLLENDVPPARKTAATAQPQRQGRAGRKAAKPAANPA